MSNITSQACLSDGVPGGPLFVGVYSTVFLVGLVLNLTALAVFFRHGKSRSHTVVYMTNLALTDLLLVLTLPLRVYYHLGFSIHLPWLCDIVGLVLLANMYGSIFLLACMCLDRCLAVSFPMSPRVCEARKKAPLVCLGVWVLTVGASLPAYISKRAEASAAAATNNASCFGNFPFYATQPVALASTLTVGFGLPLAVMLASSWGLLRAIGRSAAAAQTELVDSRKIRRMVATNLVIFLICFLPYHCMLALLYMYQKERPCPLLVTYWYSLMLACFNAMLDPLAYYFTTETFRRKMDVGAMRRMFPLHNSSSNEVQHKSRGPLNT
ncbi:lysophosphatidic acid receptor 4 [Hypomesus transpacificus]|uniref:lysophosphatidic acid receptor 4 n=1 Tax=Hypomesus transpacificus TaxID=137520 RepID=UPI001F074CA8|nr:lysophosphatidic acid receptor 4 [Hypomesus transpacificus]